MEALRSALKQRRPLRLHSAEGSAVALLLPVERSPSTMAFGVFGEGTAEGQNGRYLRIVKNGEADCNGGRNGTWTEFICEPFKTGASADEGLTMRGVKSGRWLTVDGGEFGSSEVPSQIIPELANSLASQPDELAGTKAGMAPFVQLKSGDFGLQWPVRVSRREGGNGHSVFLSTEGGGNIACGAQGEKVTNKGAQGKWAQWLMVETAQGATFQNVGHEKYLSLTSEGRAELSEVPCLFSLTAPDAATSIPSTPPIDTSVLSMAALEEFRAKGYIIVRNAVPPALVREALRNINHQLGKPDCWQLDDNPLNGAQLSLKGLVGVSEKILNSSPVFWSAINILLGTGNVDPWRNGCQVALRFPQPPSVGFDKPDGRAGTQYHIDGMGKNRLCPFSLLCGVALSEQDRPEMGNLHVFPGSHLHKGLHKYYKEKINDDNQNEADESKPDLGQSVQVLLQKGDVVIAHQLLAHRVGINTSEHIRYQLYFRVSHKRHEALKSQIIDNPWAEFAI